MQIDYRNFPDDGDNPSGTQKRGSDGYKCLVWAAVGACISAVFLSPSSAGWCGLLKWIAFAWIAGGCLAISLRCVCGKAFCSFLVILVVAGYVILASSGASWASAYLQERVYSQTMVVDTVLGPVEYVLLGSAPYMLLMHGSPGGVDAALVPGIKDPLLDAGIGVICFSRPGYLRTPLETGLTMEAQADAASALLDTIGVPRVVVHGVSGGGPAAVQFAARHPGKTAGLMLTVAVVKSYTMPRTMPYALMQPLPGGTWSCTSECLFSLMGSNNFARLQLQQMRQDPAGFVADTLSTESNFTAAEIKNETARIMSSNGSLDVLLSAVAWTLPLGPRIAGFQNDILQLTDLPPLPFDAVRCPSLLVYGKRDGDAPFSVMAAAAKAGLPHAEMMAVEDGWHIIWASDEGDAVVERHIDFIKKATA